jgi:single-stranded-DNA-specific exonuclease
MPAVWRVHPPDPHRARTLAESLGLHPLTAQLLLNRGVADPAEAGRFLRPSLGALGDPFGLTGMAQAVARFRRAAAEREPILIFGDSDTDGLTASVILYEALRAMGASVRARQSNRITDGYGLPRTTVAQLARASTRLVVLVDCGTNQPEDVRLLAERGIEVIIIDHHVPLERAALPAPRQRSVVRQAGEPHALINPCCGGIGRGMCSAGLAFKVAQALVGRDEERLAGWLDLAALGTLADCAPLVGESRLIVSLGLERIVSTRRPGLRRLCEAAGLSSAEPEAVLKKLVPKINASGRLGDVSAIWQVLLEACDERLEKHLAAVEAAHGTTRQLHRQILAEAQEQVSRLHFRDQYVMVVSRAGWHRGLMGPLASQLAQRYGRPAIALAMDEEQGTGSGRSVGRFNLFDVLRDCRNLLVRFGGHAQACGLTVHRKDLERFRELLNQRARAVFQEREGFFSERAVDLELSLGELQPVWVREMARLSPFGQGNPRPTVLLRRMSMRGLSARTGTVSDGTVRVAVRGRVPVVDPEGSYDVVASPALASGELVLTLGEARVSEAPPGPVRTSGTTCTRAPA